MQIRLRLHWQGQLPPHVSPVTSAMVNASSSYLALPIEFRYFFVFFRPSARALFCTLDTVRLSFFATASVLMLRKTCFNSFTSSFDQTPLLSLRLAVAIPPRQLADVQRGTRYWQTAARARAVVTPPRPASGGWSCE